MSFSAADLPSGTAARALIAGHAGAIVPVVVYTILRAGLIGAGLYAAGQRENVARGAIGGALAIELWVLGWAAKNQKSEPKRKPRTRKRNRVLYRRH